MQRDRGLFVPTLMTLVGLAVLVGLGVWQLERKQWKEGLVADIERGLHERPAPLDDPPGLWRVLGQREYHPVTATGTFRHADERHLFAVEDGVAGWHIYTPLDMANGLTVIVNRGFVPDEFKDPSTRKAGQIEGEVTITGLVRASGHKTWFTPAEDRSRNIWYWRDLDGMVASLPRRSHEPAPVRVLLRRREGRSAQSGRLAQGRHHAPRYPQPPPGIRDNLVRARRGPYCCIRGTMLGPVCGAARNRRWRCLSRRKHHIRLGY